MNSALNLGKCLLSVRVRMSETIDSITQVMMFPPETQSPGHFNNLLADRAERFHNRVHYAKHCQKFFRRAITYPPLLKLSGTVWGQAKQTIEC